MATYSEVKAGLDAVSVIISDEMAALKSLKTQAQAISDRLSAIATDKADVIATVNAYGTTNASEAVSKTDLAKLSAEFTALKTQADAVVADITV